jgi:membrane dipeptidase
MSDAHSPHVAEPRFVWDMVLPLAPSVGNTIDLLDRFHAAGHAYVSLTIAGDDCHLAEAMHRLALARADIARRSNRLQLVYSVADVLHARGAGKLAVGLHLEGTECLDRDPDLIELFYALGVRHAILAFNQNNSAAGGCADLGNVGLSRLGKRYLDHMRRAGMLVDLSHMSQQSSLEAIDHMGVPVVFTHSNAAAIHPHYRNVSDQQARACAASGGLIGLSGSSAYLGPGRGLAERMFRHLDHLVQLIGDDHVGLGTDYVADPAAVMRIFAERPDEWPTDEQVRYDDLRYLPPEGLADVIACMERAGYGEAAIRKILGGNYLRVAGRVWR